MARSEESYCRECKNVRKILDGINVEIQIFIFVKFEHYKCLDGKKFEPQKSVRYEYGQLKFGT